MKKLLLLLPCMILSVFSSAQTLNWAKINKAVKGNINTITGPLRNDFIINGFGIWDRTGTNNFTWCNSITGFWHGVEYRNMTTQLDIFGFAGNNMDLCDVELYLNTVPNGLGQQGVAAQPSDNIWDLNCNYNTFADNSNTGIQPPIRTEFFVRPNTGANYEGVLNGNSGGISNNCVFNASGDPNAPDFCSYIQGGDDEHRQAQRLANGMLQSDDEGLRFNYAMDLLQLFKKYPSITDSSQLMESLRDSLEQTATGQLAAINDSLFVLVDSTLNWLQNDSILFSADSLYVTSANQLKQLNNAITTSILTQWDRKKVNSIKLNTISKGIISYTNSQINTLRFIAGQCELTGGNAVPEARGMLALTDSLIGNYNSACDSVNYRKAKNQAKSSSEIIISSNPNNGNFIIEFKNFICSEISIYDVFGKFIEKLQMNSTSNEVDLSKLECGIYLIHFARNGVDEKIKKVSIIK